MTDTNLTGTYSATYMAQGPDGSGGYTPQATLALFKFTKTTFHGVIHLYRGGAPEHRTIPVAGEYALKHNDELKAIDGLIYVGLLPGADEPPTLIQKLYVVRRKKEEFDFLLIESFPVAHMERIRGGGPADPSVPPLQPQLYPPNGIVQGTFKRCD